MDSMYVHIDAMTQVSFYRDGNELKRLTVSFCKAIGLIPAGCSDSCFWRDSEKDNLLQSDGMDQVTFGLSSLQFLK